MGKILCNALLLLLVTTQYHCTFRTKQLDTPKEYNLNKPEKFLMPETLTEISGIAFANGKNDTIYAIQDEEGKVFRLAWNIKKQYHTKFGKKGDYEDLAILGNTIIVLKSNGNLYAYPFSDNQFEEIDDVTERKNLLPDGEYEGMFADDNTGKLYVICKNCKDDDNKDKVSGYIINWGDSAAVSGEFSIDVKDIKHFTGKKVKRGLRPSAIAKNPVTGEWFIVSAVNKLLIITDNKFAIKDVYPLNSKYFNQPEGIAFDSPGNLYISNEGDDISGGNILKFARLSKK